MATGEERPFVRALTLGAAEYGHHDDTGEVREYVSTELTAPGHTSVSRTNRIFWRATR
jgi:hypothetical protein